MLLEAFKVGEYDYRREYNAKRWQTNYNFPAIDRGDVKPGGKVVEYTGGSTGTALAYVSAILGLNFTAVFSDAFSKSKQQTMEAFGAKVIVEESHGKGITPELINVKSVFLSAISVPSKLPPCLIIPPALLIMVTPL